MHISELSVKKPSALIVFLTLFIGLGIYGYIHMGADLLPAANIPVITITTTYSGASAENIKKEIVKPIEDSVISLSGIDKVQSTASAGYASTVVQFKMSADMNTAFLDVQKAVDSVSGSLPKDASKPVLYKIDTNQIPVIVLTVTGNVAYDQLYGEADQIKQSLEKIPGIGQVQLAGTEKKQLMIKIDKAALEYYNVSIGAITGKLQGENLDMPAGTIEQDKIDQPVSLVGEFNGIDDIKNLIISTNNGGTVRLSQLAQVSLEYPKKDSIIRLDGKETIGLVVQKQSDANVVEAANSIKKDLAALQKQVPPGVKISVAMDTTTFIRDSLTQVKHNLVEGIITTAIVLLLFLRSWKSSIVVLIAIPTALISTFFMMHVMHFTLNMMSLMGLMLCVGILVDDSIVVLENIQRHLGMGKDPVKAAIEGRSEIGMAAIAITLCDVVVFVPVAFSSGIVGQYFKQFGLTIACASLFSLLVSFTVTPMLSSKIFKQINPLSEEKKRKIKSGFINSLLSKTTGIVENLTQMYKEILIWSLDNRKKVVAFVILLFVGSIALLPLGAISTEFMPSTDQSNLTLSVALSPGSNLNSTDSKIKIIEKHLSTIPEVKDYITQIGDSNDKASGSITVQLVPKNERKKSQSELAKEIRNWGQNLTGMSFSVNENSSDGGGNSKPVGVKISGSDYETLKKLSRQVEAVIKTVPGVIDVGNSTRTNESEIKVRVDRLAASLYGVSASDVATLLRTSMAGMSSGVYRENGEEYDIMVKFLDNQIKNTDDIGSLRVSTQKGQQIPLSEIASITREDSPQSISREDRKDIVTISANIQGRTLGAVNNDVMKKMSKLNLPTGYSISYGGSQEDMADSFTSLLEALAASVVLVYMVLVVLYESFLTPFIRLLSLPCAIIGAFLILALTGNNLSIVSMIGLIMLDGLASKNGTLLIDYTNTLMGRGLGLREALIEAGTTRLRPIIMTTVTMIVGMLPAALSLGAGSEMITGVAIVVIGGMITSTLLSPILLPVVYTMMDDLRNRKRKKKMKNEITMEV